MRTAPLLAAFFAVSLVPTGAMAQRRQSAPAPAVAAEEAPPAPRSPTLLVAANVDGATVAIDGTDVGSTPLAPVDIAAGSHTVTVRIDGYEATSRQVNIAEAGNFRVDIDLVPTPATAERLRRRQSSTSEAYFESDDTESAEGPWYERWYVWAGAGAVVATAVIVGVVVATSGGEPAPPAGAIPVPPIR